MKNDIFLVNARRVLVQGGANRQDWEGYEGWSLKHEAGSIRIILPHLPMAGYPWFWRPEFFGEFPSIDLALLQKGWSLCFLDLPDHYGSPVAIKKFIQLHDYSQRLGLSNRCGVVALSRGGLSAYNFAAAFPERVLAIYADNPVCDFRSWPGGSGLGMGSAEDWSKLLTAYSMSDAQARNYDEQPCKKLLPLIQAKIPLYHVCGDNDHVVPYDENTLVLKENLVQQGGDSFSEKIIVGRGHHPHGLDDPSELVDFFNRAHEKHLPSYN